MEPVPATLTKKPRHLYALNVLRQCLTDPHSQLIQLLRRNDGHETAQDDVLFMQQFLNCARLNVCMKLLDLLYSTNARSSSTPPPVTLCRPSSSDLCNSLAALSDVWGDLEQFVMNTREKDQPDAHELYDLLADPHIREVLVAFDDVANLRYTLDDEIDLVPVYTEPEFSAKSSVDNRRRSNGTHKNSSLDKVLEPTHLPSTEHNYAPEVKEPRLQNSNFERQQSGGHTNTDSTDSDEGPTFKSPERNPLPSSQNSVEKFKQLRPGHVSQAVNRLENADGVQSGGTKKSPIVPQTHYREPKQEFDFDPDDTSNSIPSFSLMDKPLGQTDPKGLVSTVEGKGVSTKGDRNRVKSHPSANATSPPSHHSSHQSSPASTVIKRSSFDQRTPKDEQHSLDKHNQKGVLRKHDRVSVTASPRDAMPSAFNFQEENSSASLPNRHQKATVSPDTSRHLSGSDSQRKSKRNSERQDSSVIEPNLPIPGKLRSVLLRRDRPGESIGITIAVRTPSPPVAENARNQIQNTKPVLTIQRILAGSLADKQGELFPGDILVKFNGRMVTSLNEVNLLMMQNSTSLECELLVQAPHATDGLLRPGLQHRPNVSKTKRYIRARFDYNAQQDSLCPTGHVGLTFKSGDVLELINDQDPIWWQVRPLDSNRAGGSTVARLIPSQTLEEQRQASNHEQLQGKKSKRKITSLFRASDAPSLRLRSDLWIYEEVVPWPSSSVPCLVLLGPTGVGRRTLKALLVRQYPNRFAYPISDTTDPNAEPNNFQIVSRAEMETNIQQGAYVEWGKVGNQYYGLRFAAVRKIIASDRTAVLDCQPQSVHLLYQPSFNPCVVFVGAPEFETAKQMMTDGLNAELTHNKRSDQELRSMIEASQKMSTRYRHLYFHRLTNANINENVHRLNRLVCRLEQKSSWIPSSWINEMGLPAGSSAGTHFIPGSSSLSALGIKGLPSFRISDSLDKSVLSGISEASSESAFRLSRPPSIARGVGLDDFGTTVDGGGSRRYEKRRRQPTAFRPFGPPIPEQDTPSESITTSVGASLRQHSRNNSTAHKTAGLGKPVSISSNKNTSQKFDQPDRIHSRPSPRDTSRTVEDGTGFVSSPLAAGVHSSKLRQSSQLDSRSRRTRSPKLAFVSSDEAEDEEISSTSSDEAAGSFDDEK